MEISAKPFFNFDKFFYKLFFPILTNMTKSFFQRRPYKDNPGPIYNLNSLYRYISPRELIKALHDQKKDLIKKFFQINQDLFLARPKQIRIS